MDLPRSSGLLLHISSLPSQHGIGDLGPGAYRFVDFLAASEQRWWQVLPVGPTGYGYSPYASPSTFAGNPLFISPDVLLDQGFLKQEDMTGSEHLPVHLVDYERLLPYKTGLLKRAFERFRSGEAGLDEDAYARFRHMHAGWLEDYALFMALKKAHGEREWTAWPIDLAMRAPEALARAKEHYAEDIQMHIFWQYLFHRQWEALRRYCHAAGVSIFGDLPIYVAHDSADVWAHSHLFHLDERGHPTVVAGVPPDYFSKTGQRWGNPLYQWERMRQNGYAWWKQRFEKMLLLFDLVRLDHFRGFEAYWEIPAQETTAVNGRWIKGPGQDFFEALEAHLGRLPVVAENLGLITHEVTRLMRHFSFPGMAILQFAFDSDAGSEYLPHNYVHDLVAYTGTHDNDTLVGWWTHHNSTMDREHVDRARAYALQYLNLDDDHLHELHWRCIRALMASVANVVITPVQDLLGLGSRARMNTPGLQEGNWVWRLLPDMLTQKVSLRLKVLTRLYGRTEDQQPLL